MGFLECIASVFSACSSEAIRAITETGRLQQATPCPGFFAVHLPSLSIDRLSSCKCPFDSK